jgi:hypothetical protein
MELVGVKELNVRNFAGTTLNKTSGRTFIIDHPDEGPFGMLIISANRTISTHVFECWNGTLNALKLMNGVAVLFAKTWKLEIVD